MLRVFLLAIDHALEIRDDGVSLCVGHVKSIWKRAAPHPVSYPGHHLAVILAFLVHPPPPPLFFADVHLAERAHSLVHAEGHFGALAIFSPLQGSIECCCVRDYALAIDLR